MENKVAAFPLQALPEYFFPLSKSNSAALSNGQDYE
jgi:hypothetical protein